MSAGYSLDLPRYGLKEGLTNYVATYCTHLLLSRHVLKSWEINEEYVGDEEATREDYSVQPNDSKRSFKALLDVGLVRTATGNRVFGALKGALDGGLDILHNEKCFFGYNKEIKSFYAEVHRNYIFWVHVASYMKKLREDEPEK